MKILINYADDSFRAEQRFNTETGYKRGKFDKVIEYSPEDIDEDFYEENKHILTQKRGNGYWLWKPYFVLRTLKELNDDDYLFYCDSGAFFSSSVDPLISLMESEKQDILFFESAMLNYNDSQWTKRDTFVLMDIEKKYGDTPSYIPGYFIAKKTTKSLKFFEDVLNYCKDERILTDIPNQCGYENYPEYQEHRHDQSVISLYAKKCGYKCFRDISQYGFLHKRSKRYPSSNYPTIIYLYRKYKHYKKGYQFLYKIGAMQLFWFASIGFISTKTGSRFNAWRVNRKNNVKRDNK